MDLDLFAEIAQTAGGLLTPPPELTLSQWADEYAYLSAESAATPGKWTTLPYQRGIMDAVTNPLIQRVSVMKSARVGYTKILNHAVAYHAHYSPCPIMVVQPTIEDAEGYSKDEIAPMLRDTPSLAGLFYEGKGRGSRSAAAQTILKKTFAGGNLLMVGANSARGFRRVSIRVLIMDEVDGYPASAGDEGDQEKLAEQRTSWYHDRKIIKGSTPTIKGISRIEKNYLASSQGAYHVPCPHCKHRHPLKFEMMRWPQNDPGRAYFVCPECGSVIESRDKFSMIDSGGWVHAKPLGDHAGFYIWAAYSYSPNATWGHIATEYEEARNKEEMLLIDGKTVNPIQVFTNTVLGLPYEPEEAGEKLVVEFVRETYAAVVPAGVLVLVVGADVQKDRIEATLVGYGQNHEAWAIMHRVFLGDTALPTRWTARDYDINPWRMFDDWLKSEFQHENGGVLRVACAVVDSSAFTQHVYRFTNDRFHRNIYAGKGIPGDAKPLVDLSNRKRKAKSAKRHLMLIGTFTAKDWLYNAFQRKSGTAGSVHFSDNQNAGFTPEYFQQLTSERKNLVYKGGKMTTSWILPVGMRNEALDCFVYALAAVNILNPSFTVIEKRMSQQQPTPAHEPEKPAEPLPTTDTIRRNTVRAGRRGGFVGRY